MLPRVRYQKSHGVTRIRGMFLKIPFLERHEIFHVECAPTLRIVEFHVEIRKLCGSIERLAPLTPLVDAKRWPRETLNRLVKKKIKKKRKYMPERDCFGG